MSDFTVENEADKVIDEETFASFIAFLRRYEADMQQTSQRTNPLDRQAQYPKLWENNTTSKFLEALTAWSLETRQGKAYYRPSLNPWTRFAHLVLAGLFEDD